MEDDGRDDLAGAVGAVGDRAGVGFVDERRRSREESLGERVLGSLLDRAHLMPARLVGPLVAQEVASVGGRDVSIWLQDYDQRTLNPLTGEGLVGESCPIAGSWAGRAFRQDARIEQELPEGSTRLYLPMLDGSDRVGVLAFTLLEVDDNDRRLAQRLAGLTADLIVTKSLYTTTFDRVRTAAPISLSAHLQWQTLPPLVMNTPDVALAGILEPAYNVGGDSFDYALDGHVLHLAVFDAMGHGLEAATMATVVVATYRHGRRSDASLPDLYVQMDDVLSATYPGRFATAQVGRLDTETGVLSWVNAGHPAALVVRSGGSVEELVGPITRPVGLGGVAPQVSTVQLEPGDRVLFFTDGVVEERLADGAQFGEERLREFVEQANTDDVSVAETVRLLSHALMEARGGQTSDDASLLLVEWRGPPRDDELARGFLGGLPVGDIEG
ncbi:serine/threonine-protein phosphatase [Modestobacter sp. L9-4]|uniref:PP2C family protein-serine/threonine phosphatase n=1 Tax=Modestobacter sp. L9-4 TaxID=2851567 RepID=UPI001C7903E5|nr:PP2C family protein-serine/threonine phosphatase [Modestobacter sp. L9-4]QXG74369.1 serine/threonine-protein phosphatase [Modestobacter sp. L9-4]